MISEKSRIYKRLTGLNRFSGKYETQIANIHGYKDDDYTLWRLKEKQLKTLEDLHTRKAKFIVNEACRN